MANKYTQKPLAAALGAAFLSMAASTAVQANENPFSANQLSSGYMQIAGMEGKCGGAKAEKAKEGKCGEGKCGAGKKEAMEKAKEGKCGEGKCGGKK
jgi:uncharacterized low-complexity protein